MKSTMQHVFSKVPSVEIQRSAFNRGSGLKTALNSGFLVPMFCDEVLPGDTFNLRHSILMRMSTPVVPVMDNIHVDTFYFFVPSRLVWEHWKNFNGEQRKPSDSTDYLIPQITAPSGGFEIGSVYDYFGLPTKVGGIKVNALPLRAYNLIYNEWFRDENLIDSVVEHTGDEGDNHGDYKLLRRGKRHDYFTSCLPWPQKGDGVEIPLGGKIPVSVIGDSFKINDLGFNFGGSSISGIPEDDGDQYTRLMFSLEHGQTNVYGNVETVDAHLHNPQGAGVIFSGLRGTLSPKTKLEADLSSSTSVTINSLRQAFALQRLMERDARGGTRYTEVIRAHFGVTSPDARLQRPEFLGGSEGLVNVTPVQQTSSSTGESPQGNLAAFAVAAQNGHGFTQSFTEHGYVIGLINVWCDLTYQQGLQRMWTRRTRFDFYWPALAHIGEQAVLNKEIYCDGSAKDDEVFGYQERYGEYRYKPSQITGKMRSTDPQSLDVWHLSQEFEQCPTLSKDFIEEHPPIERCLAVQDEPQFIADMYFDLKCARPMPLYGVPGMMSHF